MKLTVQFPVQVVWTKGWTGRSKSVPNLGASLPSSQLIVNQNITLIRCAASYYFKTFNSVALMLLLHLKFTCPPRCYYSARKFERTMMASLLVTQYSDHVLWTSIKVSVTEMERQKKKIHRMVQILFIPCTVLAVIHSCQHKHVTQSHTQACVLLHVSAINRHLQRDLSTKDYMTPIHESPEYAGRKNLTHNF